MKIVIAPDSFKGNLTSMQVARAMEKGIRRVLPKAKCTKVPMADGGEGTVQSLVDAMGGRFVYKEVCGPLNGKVRARYGILGDKSTAVIEMAEASGLPLLEKDALNPSKTTTYGTGELIIDALERGADKLIIGIGGSATNDGGAGMAQALGVRLLDRRGRQITKPASGGMLDRIDGIDMSAVHPRLAAARLLVACDVDNRLCGKKGASHVFGPQKGATPAMVRRLDSNLGHLAKRVKACLGKDMKTLPGAGAAGGLGGGLYAFANAKLQSGIDIVIAATALANVLESADLVFTGEGRVDSQTPFGKTPAGVAKIARKYRVPVIAIGGGLADDAGQVFAHGIHGLEGAIARDMLLDEALAGAGNYVANAAERALRLVLIGKKMDNKK